ncbi:DNA-binding response regulator [Paenibacillus tyrfis]|uniref:response regulator transcription factor n=1 Tax=Paenibacillus tyrfis TaxID=1501230 RepID=UPI002491D02C|nr:response regulator [Paenibacillus tyrfis]GLI10313.1 DNA-binding response regulator [Paenibacillus tyrfis]
MYKLLIVDDESETRNSISNYFPWEDIGFEIVGQLENGRQALDFLSERKADVVLCDIHMPVLSGIDFAREIKDRKHPVMIVFFSGYREFEYAKQALSLGVKEYIVKPPKYKDLVSAFSSLKAELDEQARRMATPSDQLDEEPEQSYNGKIISIVKHFVEENFPHASLEEAAKLVHMNANYLSQFFKKNTGSSFSDYLLTVKMQKAKELLLDVRYRTYEVGSLVGYSNSRNFARTFKKYFGTTPRLYRNRKP